MTPETTVQLVNMFSFDTERKGMTNIFFPTDSYGCLESSFTFQRRLGHFFINGYLPTVVIVAVSWYSFWLKPENTLERISLGITTLLTIYSQRVILSRYVFNLIICTKNNFKISIVFPPGPFLLYHTSK